jgi:GTP cyclohydrolase III
MSKAVLMLPAVDMQVVAEVVAEAGRTATLVVGVEVGMGAQEAGMESQAKLAEIPVEVTEKEEAREQDPSVDLAAMVEMEIV